VPLDVFVPQDLQRDVLTLQLAMDRGRAGLAIPTMALLGADRGEQLRFQRRVGQAGMAAEAVSTRRIMSGRCNGLCG